METRVVHIEIRFTRMTIAVLLGMLVLGGLVIAGRAVAQAPESDVVAPSAPAEGEGAVMMATDVISSAISYQGVLRESGTLVTGNRDMTFTLHNDSGCTGPGEVDYVEKPAVPVTDGLFSVDLGFDHAEFDGQALWLGVKVEDTVIDCQEILAAPYALSLRPGAVISDTTSYAALNPDWRLGIPPWTLYYKAAVYGRTTGTVGFNYGVYGEGTSGTGVYGTSGSGYGVYGTSTDGIGVYGTSRSGTAIFGYGDVRQTLTGDGLVKAAAYVYCGPTPPWLHRSFNNVNDDEITVSGGTGAGICRIDFGFKISDRFWVASAEPHGSTDDVFVACWPDSDKEDRLWCFVHNAAGSEVSRDLMVLIY